MSATYRSTRKYLAWRVGPEPNPVVDVLALAMGEDLQEDLVEGAEEANRYALHRVACQVCLTEGATGGREGDDGGPTLLCEGCAAAAGGIQYERHDDALVPTDGPVVELILSALNVADEVGCGTSEALGILDRAHCRVVCGLMQFLPYRRAIIREIDINDRMPELLGVVVVRTEEAVALLEEQMDVQLNRYDEIRAEALERAATAQQAVVEICRRARELAQPAASFLDDLAEQVEARYRAYWWAEDAANLYASLEAKLSDLRGEA